MWSVLLQRLVMATTFQTSAAFLEPVDQVNSEYDRHRALRRGMAFNRNVVTRTEGCIRAKQRNVTSAILAFLSLRWEAAYPLCLRYLVPVWAPPTALRIGPRMLLFFIHNYCYYHNMIGSLRLPRRQQDFITGFLSIIELCEKYLRHMSLIWTMPLFVCTAP